MMPEHAFEEIALEEVTSWVQARKEAGYNLVQMCAILEEDALGLLYSIRRGAELENRIVHGVGMEDAVPSITPWFPAAFVFENEAHDLFGANIVGISIDFKGNFYRLAQAKPMTVLTPSQIAAREKAKKASISKEVPNE